MSREQRTLLLVIHQAIDLVIVTVAFYLAYMLKIHLPWTYGGLAMTYNYNLTLALALVSYHVSLRFFGAYEQIRLQTQREVLFKLLKGSLAGIAGIVFLSYVLHLEAVSRLLLFFHCAFTFLGLALFKVLLYRLLARGRRNNFNTRNMLVVGTRQRAIEFMRTVLKRRESGYRIVGCLDTPDQADTVGDTVLSKVKIIGTLDEFQSILDTRTIDEVVFALPLKKVENVHEYIFYAELAGINVRVLPDFQLDKIKYYPQTAKVNIENFLGAPTLVLSSVPKNNNALLVKSCIDYVGAFLGVIVLAPLFLLIGLVIKMTSRGPVLFSQERSGLNGRRFRLHKFRTMVVDAEKLRAKLDAENEMDGPVFKMKKDPRVTWVGRFLRRTSLDELPQLFNVLKGEMSLVGPRPPIPAEVEHYELWQRRRLSMKPGITCTWQVSGRNEISFEQWMNMDLEYIDNWSPWLDIKLLLLTVKEMTSGHGH